MKGLRLLFAFVLVSVAVAIFLSTHSGVFGQADKGWKVWVKGSPCAGGRTDWVSVAKENPTFGGGGSYHDIADDLGLGGGLACTKEWDNSCTFSAAMAVADSIRKSPQFTNYCCHDYVVWENSQTKQLSIVKGSGSAGFGWSPVKSGLCCEEAEAFSGIPQACSLNTPVTGRPSWQPVDDAVSLQGDTLTFYAGTTPESCQADCERNPACSAFTLIRQGAYSAGAPAMCYLISRVTAAARSSCCISALKAGTTIAGPDQRGPVHRTRAQEESNRVGAPTPARPTKPEPTGNKEDDGDDAGAGGDQAKSNLNWAGTWAGPYGYTVHISGNGDHISASFDYRQTGASGSGQWSNCRVSGNSAECDYTASHDDATKSGSRRGKIQATLSGDSLNATFYEDTPQWSYKPGFSAANVNSVMYKGAQFPMAFKRQ